MHYSDKPMTPRQFAMMMFRKANRVATKLEGSGPAFTEAGQLACLAAKAEADFWQNELNTMIEEARNGD